jgi:LacI family transcriptional regulator
MRSPDEKRPTLKTIAEITGLSLSTVSLSLRHGSKLKKATRERVAEAAAQIGYVPNRAGVRLRTGKTNVISLVLATEENTLDYIRRMIHGIGVHIQHTGFHLNVVPEIERTDPVATIRYILNNRTADGVILTHTSARDPRVQFLMEHNFPFVSHGRTEFYSPHPYHDFHAERYVELAVERLASKSRRRILLIPVNDKTTNFALTVGAFNRSVMSNGIVGDVVNDQALIDGAKKARAYGYSLSQKSEPFDAIVCSSELVGLAIVSGLQDGGLILGQHYDMVCRQTTDILPTLYPEMDTLSEDLYASGAELADLLIRAIAGDEVSDLQTLHEPVVHWRS